MRKKTGRYSGYIRPFSYLLDVTVVNLLSTCILPETFQTLSFHFFISLAWVLLAMNIGFYEIYRYTKVIEIFGKIIKQYFLFLIVNFAYIGYFSKFSDSSIVLQFVSYSLILISLAKLFIYYFLRRFRVVFGGNFRKVVIVGN